MSSAPAATVSSRAPANAFYGASVREFVDDTVEVVVGALTTRSALEFRGGEREQARAWQGQVALLRMALAELPNSHSWGILLEYSLRRLGRRPDAILLGPGVVVVIEFKMGADAHSAEHARQVEDYALCIRDFHRAARDLPIVPVVCAENAPSVATAPTVVLTDSVGGVIRSNATNLARALAAAASAAVPGGRSLSWQDFDVGGYNPTPTIVEAARAVYAGHSVAEIGRTDADGVALAR